MSLICEGEGYMVISHQSADSRSPLYVVESSWE